MGTGAAAIIIGNEVLTAKVTEANGAWLIKRLRERGVLLHSVHFVLDVSTRSSKRSAQPGAGRAGSSPQAASALPMTTSRFARSRSRSAGPWFGCPRWKSWCASTTAIE